MATTNVHAELLVGRRVRDASGRVIGRIEAIHVRRRGPHYFVEEYHVGPAAWFERLGISTARMIGIGGRQPRRIPWQQLDLSDPENPRLK